MRGAGCPHCERLPLRTLRSQRVLFEEGAFTSVPRGAGPSSAEAERRLHSWGSQFDLAEGMDTGRSLSCPYPPYQSLSSPARSIARSLGSEARSAFSSPQRAGSALLLSSSEGEDMESSDYLPIQSPQYEELLEVFTHVVAKLNIVWPAENQTEQQKSKLDECFLRSKSLPTSVPEPAFFPRSPHLRCFIITSRLFITLIIMEMWQG